MEPREMNMQHAATTWAAIVVSVSLSTPVAAQYSDLICVKTQSEVFEIRSVEPHVDHVVRLESGGNYVIDVRTVMPGVVPSLIGPAGEVITVSGAALFGWQYSESSQPSDEIMTPFVFPQLSGAGVTRNF